MQVKEVAGNLTLSGLNGSTHDSESVAESFDSQTLIRAFESTVPNVSKLDIETNEPTCYVFGLQNLGNPSSMNAVLQCLLHTTEFTRRCVLLNPIFSRENKAGGNVAAAMASLINTTQSCSGKIPSVYSPSSFLQNLIARFPDHDMCSSSLDAHAFLILLLNAMDEEHDSVVKDVFYMQWRCRIQCPNCLHEHFFFESKWCLTFQSPDTSLQRMLNSFHEIIDKQYKSVYAFVCMFLMQSLFFVYDDYECFI